MVLVCCPIQKKRESKVWRRNYWIFYRQRKLLARSEDVVKASVGSTEKKSESLKQSYSSKRRKRWSTRSSLKEIVNFVFNKSARETRRTRLFRLILLKETPRRKKPKNWLLNKLGHKISKNCILSLTKVKLTVGIASSKSVIFWGVGGIILSWLECTLFLLPKIRCFRQA